ncbi:MAG: TldD/PmbA family protein, partial [Acidobacteria bacterium]|nr:TldD/PmbA family protein [Acidobacteriota bacterium]
MRQYAETVLDHLDRREVQYADVRVIEARERNLSTKNGKMGHTSSEESLGLGVRVLLQGCWGFAATDDLSADSLAAVAKQAVEIARASAMAKKADVILASEEKFVDTWYSSFRIDPFSTSVEENLNLLLQADAEMRAVPGVTLAETNLHFQRTRQFFMSTEGSAIEQTRVVTGAGMVAYSFQNDEIQKRSYPNSFGGQYQLKG